MTHWLMALLGGVGEGFAFGLLVQMAECPVWRRRASLIPINRLRAVHDSPHHRRCSQFRES
jgi:hypothetical protein